MSIKNQKFEAITLRPKERELHDLVLKLLKEGNKFRAYGGGYSKSLHSPVFDSDNMIDMKKFVEDPILEIGNADDSDGILTVSSGMTIGDIRDFLKPHGLKLFGTPGSKSISIGGAVLCGVHNSTGYWNAMSDYVIDMLLIDGLGKIRLLTDPKLFVNYGLLGIVFKIRIKVFKAMNLEWKHTLVKNINDVKITDSTYSLIFGPYSGKIVKTDIYFTEKKAHKSWKRMIWDLALWPLQFRVGSRIEALLLAILPSIGIFASELYTYEPDAIKDGFDYFESLPRSHVFTLEYALKPSDLAIIYQHIMRLIGDYRKRKTFVLRFWCRFQNAAPYINDLAFGHKTILLEVALSDGQKNSYSLVHDISEIFLEYGGKPHLGKTLLKPDELKNYDFSFLKKAIHEYDPNGVFQNKFTNEAFADDKA